MFSHSTLGHILHSVILHWVTFQSFYSRSHSTFSYSILGHILRSVIHIGSHSTFSHSTLGHILRSVIHIGSHSTFSNSTLGHILHSVILHWVTFCVPSFYIGSHSMSSHFTLGYIHRGGQVQLLFESAIAIPQLEGSTSAIAILQPLKILLLKSCNSAIAIFSEVRNFKSATWELHFRNIWHILAVE